jgi:hypothetical protein
MYATCTSRVQALYTPCTGRVLARELDDACGMMPAHEVWSGFARAPLDNTWTQQPHYRDCPSGVSTAYFTLLVHPAVESPLLAVASRIACEA